MVLSEFEILVLLVGGDDDDSACIVVDLVYPFKVLFCIDSGIFLEIIEYFETVQYFIAFLLL